MDSDIPLDFLTTIVNEILKASDRQVVSKLLPEHHLQRDLELDSLELAEMTVLIESKFGVDVFEEEIVTTVRDVLKKLK
jgi:acyl carrier protein